MDYSSAPVIRIFGCFAVGTWVLLLMFIMHEGNLWHTLHPPLHTFGMQVWVRFGVTSTAGNRKCFLLRLGVVGGWSGRWSDYRAATDMRWAPCTLTQSSCPPGRTVSSRPIRSEQQGGACKVSRERAMGENVSIAPWDAAGQSDGLCLGRLCRFDVGPVGRVRERRRVWKVVTWCQWRTNTAQSASTAEDLAGGLHQREMSTIHEQQLHTEHKQTKQQRNEQLKHMRLEPGG